VLDEAADFIFIPFILERVGIFDGHNDAFYHAKKERRATMVFP